MSETRGGFIGAQASILRRRRGRAHTCSRQAAWRRRPPRCGTLPPWEFVRVGADRRAHTGLAERHKQRGTRVYLGDGAAQSCCRDLDQHAPVRRGRGLADDCRPSGRGSRRVRPRRVGVRRGSRGARRRRSPRRAWPAGPPPVTGTSDPGADAARPVPSRPRTDARAGQEVGHAPARPPRRTAWRPGHRRIALQGLRECACQDPPCSWP